MLEDLDSLITTTNRAFFLNELDGLEDNDGLFLVDFPRNSVSVESLVLTRLRSERPITLRSSIQQSRTDPLVSIGSSTFRRCSCSISETDDSCSDFPNPSESERQSYSRYWRTKLRNLNAAIDLSDKLIEIVASRTDGFSFAYLKETFFVPLSLHLSVLPH